MASQGVKIFNCERLYRHFKVLASQTSFRTLATTARKNATQQGNTDAKNEEPTTHFGFESVRESDKEERVYQVFENVAETYDVMNDAMSMGIHRLWKDIYMKRLGPTKNTRLIDVAGGTGDIAFRFLQYVKNDRTSGREESYDIDLPLYAEGVATTQSNGSSSEEEGDSGRSNQGEAHTHVTVCDINQAMLDVGKQRAEKLGFHTGISWLKGNAESLPVADNSFDAYTIAFGIRNTTHIDKVLDEAYRVLKPGGRFLCLEFSQVWNPLLRRLYDEYSFQVIPVMGQVIARDWKSYQYLVESIRKFPNQEEFVRMIENAGFKAINYENLTMGVAAIHSGFKL